MSGKKAIFDTLRLLAFGGISGTYAPVGDVTTHAPRIVCFTNNSDADMIFSDDNTNATGKVYVPTKSMKIFDLTANIVPGQDDGLFIGIGVIWYVKQVSAPSLGNVVIEYVYSPN